MKVILLQDVKSLGKKGQIVDVNDGYARNFVLPKKLGLEASPKNLNDLKLKKQHDDKVAAENLAAAKELAAKLKEASVTTQMKVGEGGKTFGSVSSKARHSLALKWTRRKSRSRIRLRPWAATS
jgi:large subunit ribosomal protein L9